jgi:sec-independent protein translocase protein TatB
MFDISWTELLVIVVVAVVVVGPQGPAALMRTTGQWAGARADGRSIPPELRRYGTPDRLDELRRESRSCRPSSR